MSYASFHKQAEAKPKPTHNNDDDNEDNEKELTPQQVERIYSQLATKVHPVDKKSYTYHLFNQFILTRVHSIFKINLSFYFFII